MTYIDMMETWGKWVGMNYVGKEVNDILAASNFNTWIFESALPPEGTFNFSTPEADDAEQLALDYIALGGASSPANKDDYNSFYSNLKVVFYNTLQANIDQVDIALLTLIDANYDTTNDPDPEVKQRWYPIGLTLQYNPVYDAAHTWVSSMGRCKYLTPVYDALEQSGQHDLGVQWYNENLDFYHPVAISTEARVLGLDTAETKAFIQ